jgi:hypothetical protein
MAADDITSVKEAIITMATIAVAIMATATLTWATVAMAIITAMTIIVAQTREAYKKATAEEDIKAFNKEILRLQPTKMLV